MQKRGRRVTGCRCEAQPHAPSAPDAASLWYVRLRVPAGQACESRARERTLTAGSLSPLPARMDPEPPCERMQHHDAPDAWSASRASGGHVHADHLSALQQTCISLRHAAPRCRRRRADHPPGTSRGPRSSEQRAATEERAWAKSTGRGAYFEYLDCRRRCRCPAPCWCMPSGGSTQMQGKEQLVRCAMGMLCLMELQRGGPSRRRRLHAAHASASAPAARQQTADAAALPQKENPRCLALRRHNTAVRMPQHRRSHARVGQRSEARRMRARVAAEPPRRPALAHRCLGGGRRARRRARLATGDDRLSREGSLRCAPPDGTAQVPSLAVALASSTGAGARALRRARRVRMRTASGSALAPALPAPSHLAPPECAPWQHLRCTQRRSSLILPVPEQPLPIPIARIASARCRRRARQRSCFCSRACACVAASACCVCCRCMLHLAVPCLAAACCACDMLRSHTARPRAPAPLDALPPVRRPSQPPTSSPSCSVSCSSSFRALPCRPSRPASLSLARAALCGRAHPIKHRPIS
jgi:hypothetical protein